jgi:hypothetical protein
MSLIITGVSGVAYHGFPPPVYGAWTQILHGAAPYHYIVGGTKYHLKPRPPGTQYFFPYMGPSVPFSVGRSVYLR